MLEDTPTKYCKYCDCEHPLSEEFWYRLNGSPRCKLQKKASDRTCFLRNREHVREQAHIRYENNKEQIKKRVKEYVQNNKTKVAEAKAAYVKRRIKESIFYKLSRYLRSRLCSAIRGNTKSASAVRDLGCSIEALKLHLETKFTSEMNWDNHGSYWHIDHIRPLCSFDLTDKEQLMQACHYTNLQPLEAKENLRKGGKYDPSS